ncbi:MAG TPA: glycosyltransferase [Rhodopila sp.]|uniref:glycosyltransferase n=1 Tax=Rhodopila sp. TaxID=2480087 RepID=UPI002CC3A4C7|nr:glycosyltransferase [Rhodopila sp.]HVY18254.1 glycosyltransferase [Rhodopila sp.]
MELPPFVAYRDRLGVPSEVGFLRRQYVGFTRMHPIWVGRTILPQVSRLRCQVYRLGDYGMVGAARRLLFRHFDVVPRLPVPNFEPVVHAQFARGGVLALPLARSMRAALVVTLHGGDVSKAKNWRRTLLAARWPDLVRETGTFVCVSQAVAEVAAARGVPERKLTVLPIGEEIPDSPPDRAPSHYLFVGRFVEKKGLAVLAEAMRRLRAEGDATPLVCIGDGPMRPVLQALSRELPGISLPGWVDIRAVSGYMRSAVALIVPSVIAADGDAEGLPSVIPEAMAQACPVIASAQGGMAEAIMDDVSGLLAPPGDPAALARAMRRVSADADLARRLGLGGFGQASVTLNARLQSAKLETILLDAMAQRQKAGSWTRPRDRT